MPLPSDFLAFLAIFLVITIMTFLSSCCPGTASDEDFDYPPQPARRLGRALRGAPDHTHFNSNFSFAGQGPRHSDNKSGAAPMVPRKEDRGEDGASQISPRTMLSRSLEGLETSLDGRVTPQTSTGLAEGLQESLSSGYSRPTNSPAPTPTPFVRTVQRVEGSMEEFSGSDSAALKVSEVSEERVKKPAVTTEGGER